MTGAKEVVLACLVFLAISCLTTAQPVLNGESNVSGIGGQKQSTEPDSQNLIDDNPRFTRSVKMPYLDKFMEKVNQKAIRSPSLRLRFGKRSEQDSFLQNLDLLNEEYQQQQRPMLLPHLEYPGQSLEQPKQYLGFVREERKPARLRWGRSAPGQFSSAHDQLMETMDDLARVQRSKISRLRWGRSGPMTYNNGLKDLSDGELASLAIQYLINNQEYTEGDVHQSAAEEMNGKN